MDQPLFIATIAVMALLMTVVGLELKPDDFKRVVRYPRASAAGIVGSVTLLPALGFGLIALADLPYELAAGFILLVACPGGGMSNVFVYMGRGNVALSITLTAIASVVALVSLPLIAGLGFEFLLSQQADIEPPIWNMALSVIGLVLVPVGLGMVLRTRMPVWTAENERLLRRLSALLLSCLIGFAGIDQWEMFEAHLTDASLWAIIWVSVAMSAGYLLGMVFKLDRGESFAIMIEYGARNVALAITIAGTAFRDPSLAVFPSAVAVAAIGPVLLALAWFRRRSTVLARRD